MLKRFTQWLASKTQHGQRPEPVERHTVGEFFWIPADAWIGFAENASHGHGLKVGGSVAAGDTVRVLKKDETRAVVVLERSSVPYGAPAATGAIFELPLDQIAAWPEQLSVAKWKDDRAAAIRQTLGRVTVGG